MTDKKESSIWGGRFSEATDQFVARFTASIEFDQRLTKQDIQGSIAHATMLKRIGILSQTEFDDIQRALTEIAQAYEAGALTFSVELEDIHMNIEALLTEKIGQAGKKLHTGRSRNDQVATDIKLYLRNEIDLIQNVLVKLQTALVNLADNHHAVIMPGFTHLQTAQPVTFGHHMMAWYEMLERDFSRLVDCRKRLNESPLGAAALAGTTYPIDRELTAQLLDFDQPTRNSLDSVSDRDFAIEFTACASLILMHLSRFAEELILWSAAQFDFIELPDRFCTGSSIMPQKKNPDVPELVRGKSARVFGNLTQLLVLMKSQPLAYNKDNQEDKEPLFDTVDTVKDCLFAFANMMSALKIKPQNMLNATRQGFATATDLADYLVKKGLPFRDSHEVVGKTVALAIDKQLDLAELSLDQLQQFSSLITEDVFDILSLEGSVNARNHFGGTAPNQVKNQVNQAKVKLQSRQHLLEV